MCDEAPAQGDGGGAVALEAESAHVREAAFATAFGDGEDVVGVPQVAAEAPVFFELAAGCVIELAFVFAQGFGVEAARGAHALVAGEDLLAQIAGVGAQLPLVNAGVAAKCEAAGWDFAATAAARAALPPHPPAGLDAARAHTRRS